VTLKTHYLKNSIIYSVNSKNIIWKTLNPVTNTKQFLIVFHIEWSTEKYILHIYMCCWNVATYKWKVHNGKIEIISFGLGSISSLFLATVYQGNHDRNHKLGIYASSSSTGKVPSGIKLVKACRVSTITYIWYNTKDEDAYIPSLWFLSWFPW
jgi:hypothetical protein